jgi:hypothetical protein
LYILFVLVTIAIGVMGVRAVVLLVQGKKNAYRYSLIAMILGLVVGGIHMAVSRLLRVSSMPVDAVVYTTVLTLVVFLLLRIPGIWQGVDFEKPAGDKKTGKQAASIALGAVGLLTLTIQFLMVPTHTIGGVNYADVWHIAFSITGVTLIFASIATAVYTEAAIIHREVLAEATK